jgi:PAS domain S-box-containing protein
MVHSRDDLARDARRTFPGWKLKLPRSSEAGEASRPLSWHLGVATLKVMLPLIAVALILVGWIARDERQAKEALLVRQTHSLADAVALQIDRYFVLANALSHSSWLERADLAGFEQQATETLAGMPDVTLLVSGADGRPLLSVPHVADDSPLWRGRAALVKRSIASGVSFLSDVSADAAAHEARASVETPVLRDGEPIYEIALVLSLNQFDRLLRDQKLPAGWLSGIVDRNGAFVARFPAESELAGMPASPEFREAAKQAPSGIVAHVSRKGRQVLSAYVATPNGWTAGVAAGANGFAIGPSAFVLTAILAAAALSASLVLSFLSSLRLTRQMKEMQKEAETIFGESFRAPAPTGVREFDGLSQALARASKLLAERAQRQKRAEDDLRRSEEHFRVLADSLPQLVWTAGPDGRVDYTNARRERYGMRALSQTDWAEMIHPEDRRATAAAWLQASEAAVPYEMEHRLMVVGKGYTWHLSRAIPLFDAEGEIVRWYGTTTDIHDQKVREENVTQLMTEVNHRSRNLLAVALAIARRTVTTSRTVREFEKKFFDRLLGLIAHQDLLIAQNWQGVPIKSLVLAQVALPEEAREGRLELDGPEILLSPTAAQTLGLALRELYNNALAYGALSSERGNVSVRWRIEESGAEPVLEMLWREQGGPAVDPQAARGFGSILIEHMVVQGLNASATLTFDVEGVRWRFVAPLRDVQTRWEFQGSSAPVA